jgi:hypothetical protein
VVLAAVLSEGYRSPTEAMIDVLKSVSADFKGDAELPTSVS